MWNNNVESPQLKQDFWLLKEGKEERKQNMLNIRVLFSGLSWPVGVQYWSYVVIF